MSLFTVLGDDAKSLFAPFAAAFVQDDVGKLAIAAVQYAEAKVEGDGDDKKEAAKTQLLNAAQAAGKDLVAEGEAVLNSLLEVALQIVTADVVAAI